MLQRIPSAIPDGGADSREAQSTPYLTVIAPPSLRFRDPPAPPSFELDPMPMTAGLDETAFGSPPPIVAKEKPELAAADISKAKKETVPQEKKAENQEIPAILPDDLRRDVRPEELLPFFQFPRGGAMMPPGVPSPAQAPVIPPSSATYRLQ